MEQDERRLNGLSVECAVQTRRGKKILTAAEELLMSLMQEPEDLEESRQVVPESAVNDEDAQSTLDVDCILSALCLPPVEGVVIVNEQTPTETGSQTESTLKTENMEIETDPHVSENERERRKKSRTEGYSNDIQPSTEQQQMEDEVAVERVEDMEQEYGEPVSGGRSKPVSETVMVVREDGTLMPLNVLVRRPQKDPESRDKTKRTGKKLIVTLERLDISNMAVPPPSRSVSDGTNPKKPHQCPECDQAFCRKSHYVKHMKVHHGGLKFPCSVCGKQLCSGASLTKHMLIHNGVKAFSCSYQGCDKVFRAKKQLTVHTRYHTGERPFKCRHCGKGFVQSSYATTHELTHTQERPHVCTVCGKGFNLRSNFKRHHERIHTGEKPFKCHECGEAFKRRYHLMVHKQKHH